MNKEGSGFADFFFLLVTWSFLHFVHGSQMAVVTVGPDLPETVTVCPSCTGVIINSTFFFFNQQKCPGLDNKL